MVSHNIIRVAVTALCVGHAVVAAPVTPHPKGDSSVGKPNVNKRWTISWAVFPKAYEDAIDENGNPKLSDTPFDLDKIDLTKLAESIHAAQAAKADQAGGAAHK